MRPVAGLLAALAPARGSEAGAARFTVALQPPTTPGNAFHGREAIVDLDQELAQ